MTTGTGNGNGNGTGIDVGGYVQGPPGWNDQDVQALFAANEYTPGMFNPEDFYDPEKARRGIEVFDRKWEQRRQNEERQEAIERDQAAVDAYLLANPHLVNNQEDRPDQVSQVVGDQGDRPDQVNPEDVIDDTGGGTGGDTGGDTPEDGIDPDLVPEVNPDRDEVLEFEGPDLPGMEGIPDQRDAIWSMLMGDTPVPYMESIMEDLRHQQALARDELRAGQGMRGIINSTPGFAARDRQLASQAAARGTAALQGLSAVVPGMQKAVDSTYDQDMGVRKQSFDEFLGLNAMQGKSDAQMQSDRAQALTLLLNALGVSTVNPQLPNFSTANPGGDQGDSLWGSFGRILGNVASMQDKPWWWGSESEVSGS